jgi:UPF0716 family protein affecting phage T7 exclusion
MAQAHHRGLFARPAVSFVLGGCWFVFAILEFFTHVTSARWIGFSIGVLLGILWVVGGALAVRKARAERSASS